MERFITEYANYQKEAIINNKLMKNEYKEYGLSRILTILDRIENGSIGITSAMNLMSNIFDKMQQVFIQEDNIGKFVLSFNSEGTKGFVYRDSVVYEIYKKNSLELSHKELKEFAFGGCLEYENGFEIFGGEQLQEYMDCKTVKKLIF